MAKVNLLNASFDGKLGGVYGAKQYSGHFIKAVPFSHSPHSHTQTRAVRAFEKLNRLSSGISSVAFPFLNLSDKKMLRHNAVAKWLKPLIQDKIFIPSRISEVIPTGEETEILALDVNREKNEITISAKTNKPVSVKNKNRWFVFVFNDFGNVLIAEAPTKDFFLKTISTPLDENAEYYAIAFRSDKEKNKFFINGLSLTIPLIVKNGILYTSLLEDKENFSVQNGILKYTGTMYELKNNLLIIK